MSKTPRYSVHAEDGSVLATYSRKEQAVDHYERDKAVAFVLTPAGKPVAGAPSPEEITMAASRTKTTPTAKKASPAKPKAEPKPKRTPSAPEAEKQCSLKRLQGWADKYGYEVFNGTQTPEGYSVEIGPQKGLKRDSAKFLGRTARDAYGMAQAHIKAQAALDAAKNAA